MKFTQEEIEGDIGELVPRDMRKAVAAKTGIYPSVVYGYFNGDDERRSPMFTTLLIQDALDAIDEEVGDAVWEKICAFREAGKRRRQVARDLTSTLIEKSTNDISTNNKVLQAIRDGRIDKREFVEINQSIDTEIRDLDKLRQEVAHAAEEAVH